MDFYKLAEVTQEEAAISSSLLSTIFSKLLLQPLFILFFSSSLSLTLFILILVFFEVISFTFLILEDYILFRSLLVMVYEWVVFFLFSNQPSFLYFYYTFLHSFFFSQHFYKLLILLFHGLVFLEDIILIQNMYFSFSFLKTESIDVEIPSLFLIFSIFLLNYTFLFLSLFQHFRAFCYVSYTSLQEFDLDIQA